MFLRALTRVFAVVGLLLTILCVGGGTWVVMHNRPKAVTKPKDIVLTVDFNTPIINTPSPTALTALFHDSQNDEIHLLALLSALKRAKTDPAVKGVIAHFGDEQPPMAAAWEIRQAILDLRNLGKLTYAHGGSFGGFGEGNRAYYLGSAFENLWLEPMGTVSLTSPVIQVPFARAAFDKIGLQMEVFQREEYKSFMDTAIRQDFAEPVRQNMTQLVQDMAGQMATDIAQTRGWTASHVMDLMKAGPYTAEEALNNKLVDHLGYEDDVDAAVKTTIAAPTFISLSTYLSYPDDQPSLTKTTAIAVIQGEGIISENGESSPLDGDVVMNAKRIADAFSTATKSNDIRAVLFRVDSEGGSPEASEIIRRALIKTQAAGKKVYVSMGDTAASGGYWVSMNADKIFATPLTITGSIGVIGGRPNAAMLMDKIGIHMGTIGLNNESPLWSPTAPLSARQKDRMNAYIDATYHAFLTRLSEARHIPADQLPAITKGRVWSAQAAMNHKLIDGLGGYDVAMDAIRQDLKMAPDDRFALVMLPENPNPLHKLLKMLRRLGTTGFSWQTILGYMDSFTSHAPQSLSPRLHIL